MFKPIVHDFLEIVATCRRCLRSAASAGELVLSLELVAVVVPLGPGGGPSPGGQLLRYLQSVGLAENGGVRE